MNKNKITNKKNIVIRLSSIGDIILISGVLDYWNKQNQTKFTVITKSGFACLLKNHPAIENIIELNTTQLNFIQLIKTFYTLASQYKQYILIDLHCNLRTFLLKIFWKNKIQNYAKFSKERKTFLKNKNDIQVKSLLNKYTIPQRYALALTNNTPENNKLLPQLFLTDQETARGKKLLAETIEKTFKIDSVSEKNIKVVAIHPYASYQPKAWHKEHWEKLVQLLDAAKIPWVCIGRNKDKFFNTTNDLTNLLDLRESAALLKACTLFITPDSGPMHLARAVKTPLIGLFGPTVKEWGFYPDESEGLVLETDLACRPCSLHGKKPCKLPKEENCMFKITPERVFENILKILNKNSL
ncbi:glycosyltransferase family 9 protein [Desulfovibrio litoralis]|uniref:ADP-heptose:LPS heptosyltransferase n=1 Tax=Desulfovibrio litoralis DSM 11393 TaxID=1121455 RepID=A0A1M7S0Y7_9BACT|nr:glycosyltransferase family 9 protein [Desulfovibrio litoralis]SHN52151.1 ADP-heptose:LPS heptosyltransferase [Desulfovibrio litoralis DSM 11393]